MSGGGNPVALQWKHPPDLLFNEESLLDIILNLRTKIDLLEKNDMGSGDIPQWLVDAMQNIANNSEAMVECQNLKDQLKYMKQNIDALQKDIVVLRRDVVAAKTITKRRVGVRGGDDDGDRNGDSTSRRGSSAILDMKRSGVAVGDGIGNADIHLNPADEAMRLTVALQSPSDGGQAISSAAMEQLLEPVMHSIERQKEEFAVMRENSQAAKDSVTRLQAEMKRRDALIQARNSKHEASVKILMDKLNHDLRACVTHNEMISFEQKMIVLQKQELSRLSDEFGGLFGRVQEDLYAVRSSQEDINSSQAESIQTCQSKILVLNDRLDENQRGQDRLAKSMEEVKRNLQSEHQQVQSIVTQSGVMKEKLQAIGEKQIKTDLFCADMSQAIENVNINKLKSEEMLKLVIHQRAEGLQAEINRIDQVMESCSLETMAEELKLCGEKLIFIDTLGNENKIKINLLEKQVHDNGTIYNTNFTNIYEGIDKTRREGIENLKKETNKIGNKLKEHDDGQIHFSKLLNEIKTDTERTFSNIRIKIDNNQLETDGMRVNTEAALKNLKEKIFFCEESNLNLKTEMEINSNDTKILFSKINNETKNMNGIIQGINNSFNELENKQNSIEKQLDVLQHDFRNEITVTTSNLIDAVAKEGQRTEALYAAFAEKQEKFADIVAKSSTRNMPISAINKELDKLCDQIIGECWKFEIGSKQEGQNGPLTRGDNNGASRKQFSERQQIWLVKNCQFFADLICAKAEFDILRNYTNKDTKSQTSLDAKIIRMQGEVMEKLQLRIIAKISNNKNCGEQFDRGALERREIFMQTIQNITEGALARRTLCGGLSPEENGFSRTGSMDGSMSCMESIRLQASGRPSTNGFEGSPGGRAKKRMSDLTQRPDTTGINDQSGSRRIIQSPHAASPFVFRGGFRIPNRNAGINAMSDAFRDIHAEDEHAAEEFIAEDEGIHPSHDDLTLTPSVSLPAL